MNPTFFFLFSTISCVRAIFFFRFVPLLVPWVDVWLNNPRPGTYPPELVAALKAVLRTDVPYVTVSQVTFSIK